VLPTGLNFTSRLGICFLEEVSEGAPVFCLFFLAKASSLGPAASEVFSSAVRSVALGFSSTFSSNFSSAGSSIFYLG
jgi:hypothetical protein